MCCCGVGVVVGDGGVVTVAVLLSAIWHRTVTLHGYRLGRGVTALRKAVMTGLVSSWCWAHKQPRARCCRVVN